VQDVPEGKAVRLLLLLALFLAACAPLATPMPTATPTATPEPTATPTTTPVPHCRGLVLVQWLDFYRCYGCTHAHVGQVRGGTWVNVWPTRDWWWAITDDTGITCDWGLPCFWVIAWEGVRWNIDVVWCPMDYPHPY